MATSKLIGGIQFGVSMSTQKLQKDIKAARKMIGGFVKGVGKMSLAITGLGGAISAVGLAKFTADAFGAIDSLAKASDKLGVTTEALAGLRLAAEETGAGTAALDKGLTNLTKLTGEAAQGIGLGVRAFDMLGLSAARLNKLSPDKQFLEVADAMSKLTNKQDQLTVATQLFGVRGATLVNTLRLGREGLNETAEAAINLGLAVDRESARGVEKAIDSFNRFRAAVGGVFRQVAVEIAPLIEGMTAGLTSFLAQGGKAKVAGQSIGKFIIETGKLVGDVMQQAAAAMMRMAAFGIEAFERIKEFVGGTSSVQAFTVAGQLRQSAFQIEQNPISGLISKLQANQAQRIAQASGGSGLLGGLLGRAKGFAGNFAATPGQIASGIGNNPINKLMGGLFSSLFSNFDPTKLKSFAKPKFTPGQAGSGFSVAEAGSAEAHRMRVRIKQNTLQEKLDKQRNEKLDMIYAQLKKTQMAPAGLT